MMEILFTTSNLLYYVDPETGLVSFTMYLQLIITKMIKIVMKV